MKATVQFLSDIVDSPFLSESELSGKLATIDLEDSHKCAILSRDSQKLNKALSAAELKAQPNVNFQAHLQFQADVNFQAHGVYQVNGMYPVSAP